MVTEADGSATTAGNKRASWKLLFMGPELAWVFERLAAFLAARASWGFELDEIDSPLKVQRYEVGDFHGWHADLATPSGRRRKLGITVQLSAADAYRGGDLRFFDPPAHRAGPRERGCAIAFPAYLPHEVTRVEAGVRYALTAWAMGPPFR
jgi:PKHD-type hydroxylase